jgi:hypothetical protein
MKVSTENDNNHGYEKNTILVDNMPLNGKKNIIFTLVYVLAVDHHQRFVINYMWQFVGFCRMIII